MKLLAAILPIVFSAAAHATICEPARQIKFEMNFVSSNIANVITTRTPEGGPYKPFTRVYSGSSYEYVQLPLSIDKYEPGHPDANADGYVAYPDINVRAQIEDMCELAKKYEAAIEMCNQRSP